MRRNPTQTMQTEKLSNIGGGDDVLDTKSMQQFNNEASARSIFQVAYSQKSDKQGGSHGQVNRDGCSANPL